MGLKDVSLQERCLKKNFETTLNPQCKPFSWPSREVNQMSLVLSGAGDTAQWPVLCSEVPCPAPRKKSSHCWRKQATSSCEGAGETILDSHCGFKLHMCGRKSPAPVTLLQECPLQLCVPDTPTYFFLDGSSESHGALPLETL